ncbi:phage tail protein [Pseudomonas sp. TMW 2.1634]|uniref:phage tail-collar fiber domain-containing protein n=1 Tax=Pseudomonas sp. TMW 2.1634 TaxID=1886807 RepID=UPI000E74BE38|nr:phage tail protein [Pseudomonas sp. TMW 2.1634]AOA04249.1 phage tail protein [Pseudomonas sp. TMW 2.1634]AOA05692.1 phage tail protein [Pseudomonas sp. TMW 2.1634]AOA08938.1 phage tail protein [Pseudomonas sp. TMW 2.1634]
MSTPLQPLITKAGLAAIWRADNTGVAAEITHIVVGTTGYTPVNTQTALRAQVAKYAISDGQRLSDTLIHVTAVADDTKAYWAREIGFLLSDGTLLAVWSHPTEALTYKSANAELLLAYDLSLTALPANSVTITSTGAGLNLTLSAELAALATAQIASQLRGIKYQDTLDDQAKLHQIEGQQIANLMDRMKAAELRQGTDHDELLTAIAANATAMVGLQTLFSKTTLGV